MMPWPQLMLTLIGLLKEVLHQSRTKDNAVHAGPSLPLELLSLLLRLEDKLLVSLNNNSSIAQDHMEITDATVDGHHQLSTMLKTMVLPVKANIPIELLPELAKNKEDLSKFNQLPASADAQEFKMVSKQNQSQLQLMPVTGANIHQVYSLHAQHQLTMQSFWLVSSVETGRLKILGELDGENKVILD